MLQLRNENVRRKEKLSRLRLRPTDFLKRIVHEMTQIIKKTVGRGSLSVENVNGSERNYVFPTRGFDYVEEKRGSLGGNGFRLTPEYRKLRRNNERKKTDVLVIIVYQRFQTKAP